MNTSTPTLRPRFATDRRLLVISTRAAPPAGTNGSNMSGFVALSKTTRHLSPSVSIQCRTTRPASALAPWLAASVSWAASATAAKPASKLPGSFAFTQATRRHLSASLARAYAAASFVLPTPRMPITARTTEARGPA